VGQAEFELVRRRYEIFSPPAAPTVSFPVLSGQYTTQIARDWNAKDQGSGFRG